MKATNRPFNTAVFLLRCYQLGIGMEDLDALSVGMVYDLIIEQGNDSADWQQVATQRDFDRF